MILDIFSFQWRLWRFATTLFIYTGERLYMHEQISVFACVYVCMHVCVGVYSNIERVISSRYSDSV